MKVARRTDCRLAIPYIQRIVGLADKDPLSRTYGCFDRDYWKYRNKDFSNARMQEAVLTLALVYGCDHPDNPYHHDEDIRRLAIAGMRFWANGMNPAGSCDEYYPSERSFVATAFSSFAVAYAMMELKIDDGSLISALKRSAAWLAGRSDSLVANHVAACVPLYHMMHMLTEDKRYKALCREKLALLSKMQHEEGWFHEYGGSDSGYQSLSIYYLSIYHLLSKDKGIGKMLAKAVEFMLTSIHPDGTTGGSYNSRGTSFLIPSGFHRLSPKDRNAYTISSFMIENHDKLRYALSSLDDRFICQSLYAYIDHEEARAAENDAGGAPAYPWNSSEDSTKYLPGCGICAKKKGRHYIVVNVRKNGMGKVFRESQEVLSFSGVSVPLKDGILLTDINSKLRVSEDVIEMEGRFSFRKSYRSTSLNMALVRAAAIILGERVNIALRKRLAGDGQATSLVCKVMYSFDGNGIRFSAQVPNLNGRKAYLLYSHSHPYSTSTQFGAAREPKEIKGTGITLIL